MSNILNYQDRVAILMESSISGGHTKAIEDGRLSEDLLVGMPLYRATGNDEPYVVKGILGVGIDVGDVAVMVVRGNDGVIVVDSEPGVWQQTKMKFGGWSDLDDETMDIDLDEWPEEAVNNLLDDVGAFGGVSVYRHFIEPSLEDGTTMEWVVFNAADGSAFSFYTDNDLNLTNSSETIDMFDSGDTEKIGEFHHYLVSNGYVFVGPEEWPDFVKEEFGQ